jgi:hypothetical protein
MTPLSAYPYATVGESLHTKKKLGASETKSQNRPVYLARAVEALQPRIVTTERYTP